MKKHDSLVNKILMMIVATSFLIFAAITLVGAYMIYSSTESSLKSEIDYAAHTLNNLYNSNYHGEYYLKDDKLYKGDTELTDKIFNNITHNIGGSSDIDYTIFWGDTRIFTSVRNSDGTPAIGTKASSAVVRKVLNEGMEYYYSSIDVNEENYIGYYIPIVDSCANTVGMIFAGKPLRKASSIALKMVAYFLAISCGIMAVSAVVSMIYLKGIVVALGDIKNYMTKIAICDFQTEMHSATFKRRDEIGDIARSAVKLCNNLRDLIERDPLTSLLNRRSCRSCIDDMKARGVPIIVAMGDIDFFKKINDNYGHAAGDAVLKGVSDIIKRFANGHGGISARWGGEEFLIVLSDMNFGDMNEYMNDLMEEIRGSVFECGDSKISVTMTFGVAEHDKNKTVDDTINRADELLYSGKQSGRNKVVM